MNIKDLLPQEKATSLASILGKVVFENEKGVKETFQSGDYVSIEPLVKHWVDAITTTQLILFK